MDASNNQPAYISCTILSIQALHLALPGKILHKEDSSVAYLLQSTYIIWWAQFTGNIFSSFSCTFITYSELTFKRWTVTSCVRCIYFMIITYICIVSYPTRWFFSYMMGHLQWSYIFPTSREHRNILQLCINICINWHILDSTFKSPCRTPINIRSNIWTPKV